MDIRILIRTKTDLRDNPYFCTKIFRFVLLRVKKAALICDKFTVRFTESKEADLSFDHFTVRFTESKKAVVSFDLFD
jgi:hypothetical protein